MTMDFLTRINAVLHHQPPDRVPFAPYDNLVPRGEFSRQLGNRGMGLVLRGATLWEETPHVSCESRREDHLIRTIYHTPVGDIYTTTRANLGRIGDSQSLAEDGLIKTVKDYDAAICMIEDTEFQTDNSQYYDHLRDLGRDGIFIDYAFDTPYNATRYLFGGNVGFENWIYEQHDHPDHFARLMQALEKRVQMIAQSPAEYLGIGSIDGTWGAADFTRYELPIYKKFVPFLQAHGKKCFLHGHASNMSRFKAIVAEIHADVVEAFTPPPIGDLSVKEARTAWGADTVIWVNFPETIFYQGAAATRAYTAELLCSDPPGDRLVIGFTEMGFWGAVTDELEVIFKAGTAAIMDAIDDAGVYPIQ
jgi:hypothetical protein